MTGPTPPHPAPINVVGGPGGITADCEAMLVKADALSTLSGDALHRGASLQRLLFSPELAAPALFDPVGAAHFEFALAGALDGLTGLMATAMRISWLDIKLRAAATAYQSADNLYTAWHPYVEALGNLPQALRTFAGVSGRLESDLLNRRFDELADDLTALQQVVVADPAVASVLVHELSQSRAFKVLRGLFVQSQLMADGKPQLSATGLDPVTDRAGPPRNLTDIVTGLANRSSGGNVDVRILSGGPTQRVGQRRVIVDIPGTDDWSISNGNPDVTNLGTNVLAIDGTVTTYERGVIEAMRAAGVTSSDDVMLVGHSQGGMVAVTTARDVMASGEFNVSHVVTAGSPIAATVAALDQKVKVLAIENRSDVVPMLDGADNPDLENVTTVTVDHPHRQSVGDNHGMTTAYIPGARDIDANTGSDPSVSAYLKGMQSFLAADRITTQTFRITRATE